MERLFVILTTLLTFYIVVTSSAPHLNEIDDLVSSPEGQNAKLTVKKIGNNKTSANGATSKGHNSSLAVLTKALNVPNASKIIVNKTVVRNGTRVISKNVISIIRPDDKKTTTNKPTSAASKAGLPHPKLVNVSKNAQVIVNKTVAHNGTKLVKKVIITIINRDQKSKTTLGIAGTIKPNDKKAVTKPISSSVTPKTTKPTASTKSVGKKLPTIKHADTKATSSKSKATTVTTKGTSIQVSSGKSGATKKYVSQKTSKVSVTDKLSSRSDRGSTSTPAKTSTSPSTKSQLSTKLTTVESTLTTAQRLPSPSVITTPKLEEKVSFTSTISQYLPTVFEVATTVSSKEGNTYSSKESDFTTRKTIPTTNLASSTIKLSSPSTVLDATSTNSKPSEKLSSATTLEATTKSLTPVGFGDLMTAKLTTVQEPAKIVTTKLTTVQEPAKIVTTKPATSTIRISTGLDVSTTVKPSSTNAEYKDTTAREASIITTTTLSTSIAGKMPTDKSTTAKEVSILISSVPKESVSLLKTFVDLSTSKAGTTSKATTNPLSSVNREEQTSTTPRLSGEQKKTSVIFGEPITTKSAAITTSLSSSTKVATTTTEASTSTKLEESPKANDVTTSKAVAPKFGDGGTPASVSEQHKITAGIFDASVTTKSTTETATTLATTPNSTSTLSTNNPVLNGITSTTSKTPETVEITTTNSATPLISEISSTQPPEGTTSYTKALADIDSTSSSASVNSEPTKQIIESSTTSELIGSPTSQSASTSFGSEDGTSDVIEGTKSTITLNLKDIDSSTITTENVVNTASASTLSTTLDIKQSSSAGASNVAETPTQLVSVTEEPIESIGETSETGQSDSSESSTHLDSTEVSVEAGTEQPKEDREVTETTTISEGSSSEHQDSALTGSETSTETTTASSQIKMSPSSELIVVDVESLADVTPLHEVMEQNDAMLQSDNSSEKTDVPSEVTTEADPHMNIIVSEVPVTENLPSNIEVVTVVEEEVVTDLVTAVEDSAVVNEAVTGNGDGTTVAENSAEISTDVPADEPTSEEASS